MTKIIKKHPMMSANNIKTRDFEAVFIDNPALSNSVRPYICITVNIPYVLKSWQKSLFSFEWLHPDGRIKALHELSENEQEKRRLVEEQLAKHMPLKKPVLGIGVLENVEIGMGRAEFLTLAACGLEHMPVHIPQDSEKDFKPFLAEIE